MLPTILNQWIAFRICYTLYNLRDKVRLRGCILMIPNIEWSVSGENVNSHTNAMLLNMFFSCRVVLCVLDPTHWWVFIISGESSSSSIYNCVIATRDIFHDSHFVFASMFCQFHWAISANWYWPCVLDHRLRHWPNINPAFGRCQGQCLLPFEALPVMFAPCAPTYDDVITASSDRKRLTVHCDKNGERALFCRAHGQ